LNEQPSQVHHPAWRRGSVVEAIEAIMAGAQTEGIPEPLEAQKRKAG
jgi:hypothetical protein